jgi:hypothetical protein
MPIRFPLRRASFLIALGLAGPACALSGAASPQVIVVTATPEGGARGGRETAPTAATPSGSPPAAEAFTPTASFTVAHLLTPPGATGTTRYITDPETRDYAPQKRAPAGADNFALNRYERPYRAETMEYLSDVDLKRVEMRIADPWIYITFDVGSPRAEGIGQTVYGAEFDTDKDGRGEYLVWGVSPPGEEWTAIGVEVWQDDDNDVGGSNPQASEAPKPGANGYERRLFADGQGADPDLAWIRRAGGGAQIQLAFKHSALSNASQFLWNGLADAGVRNHEWFDYNDHFTREEAGSPYPAQAEEYPLKALAAVDNTCRDAYGFTPTGNEPGLCLYSGTITGTLFRDGTCDNLAGWHNGVLDAGEPGSNAGQILLGQGACPSSGYRSATPGADGRFTFADVPIGTYCVSHAYSGFIEYTTPHEVTVTLAPEETEVVNIGIYVELGCPPGGF